MINGQVCLEQYPRPLQNLPQRLMKLFYWSKQDLENDKA